MELFQIIILTGPTALFAYQYYVDIYSSEKVSIGFGIVIPVLLFMLYLVLVAFVGINGIMELFQDKGVRYKGLFTFLLPGIGFALAAFPYQATELSKYYISLSKYTLNLIYRSLGWLLIIAVVIRHLIVLSN